MKGNDRRSPTSSAVMSETKGDAKAKFRQVQVVLEPLQSDKEDNTRLTILLCLWAVILAAVPFWWQSTTVYRAALPFDEIKAWTRAGALDTTIGLHVHIVPDSASVVPSLDVQAIQAKLNSLYSFKTPDAWEKAKFKMDVSFHVEQGPKRTREDALDRARNYDPGRFAVHMSCSQRAKSNVSITAGRAILVALAPQDCNKGTLEDVIVKLAGGVFADEQYDYFKLATNVPMDRPEDLKVIKHAKEYQLTFSLLNGNPEDGVVYWDIEEALRVYFDGFFQKLATICTFYLNSQVINYASLHVEPRLAMASNGASEFHLTPDMQSLFINSEWNLASAVSVATPLEFLMYVPAKAHSPLHVLNSDDSKLDANAFLIPQWGGVVVSNVHDRGRVGSRLEFNYTVAALHEPMSLFMEQLRGLVGVKPVVLPQFVQLEADIDYHVSPDAGLTDFELDRLTRWRTVLNLVDAIKTLNSLSNLINSLPNMVVLDEIQEKVLTSLKNIRGAHHALKNQDFCLASQLARDAINMAEAAFFDPTMVSLLYFPDEHKFAVYMPIFVPISVPLVVILLKELRRFVKRRRERLAKKNE